MVVLRSCHLRLGRPRWYYTPLYPKPSICSALMGKGWGFLLQKNFKGELKDFTWMYSRHVKPQPYLKNPNTHQGSPGVAWDMRQFSQIKQDISHYARWQDQVTRSAGNHCCFSSYCSTLKMHIIPESIWEIKIAAIIYWGPIMWQPLPWVF